MTEPLHDLIAQAVIDEIAGIQSVSEDEVELRMSFEFYERFAEWMYRTQKFYPTGQTRHPSFMGVLIHRDDWDYDWKVVPIQRWPPE